MQNFNICQLAIAWSILVFFLVYNLCLFLVVFFYNIIIFCFILFYAIRYLFI